MATVLRQGSGGWTTPELVMPTVGHSTSLTPASPPVPLLFGPQAASFKSHGRHEFVHFPSQAPCHRWDTGTTGFDAAIDAGITLEYDIPTGITTFSIPACSSANHQNKLNLDTASNTYPPEWGSACFYWMTHDGASLRHETPDAVYTVTGMYRMNCTPWIYGGAATRTGMPGFSMFGEHRQVIEGPNMVLNQWTPFTFTRTPGFGWNEPTVYLDCSAVAGSSFGAIKLELKDIVVEVTGGSYEVSPAWYWDGMMYRRAD